MLYIWLRAVRQHKHILKQPHQRINNEPGILFWLLLVMFLWSFFTVGVPAFFDFVLS